MFKKFTQLFVVILMLSAGSFAQYSNYKVTCSEQNPNNLNTNDEYTPANLNLSLPANEQWTVILNGGPTQVWSAAQTIPFAFNFNGNNFTSYKVATTGVVTFDLTATTVPDSLNLALPQASIPNNSICCWGLVARNTGDELGSKTFGTAPNRQHWIYFASFTKPNVISGNTNYTYWSIVLEETTNNIYIVDERNYVNTGLSLTVGVQIDATTAYSATGSPNITSGTSVSGIGLPTPNDNQYFVFNTAFSKQYDVKHKSCNLKAKYSDFPYRSLAGPHAITGDLSNLGSLQITSMNVSYSVDGGAPVTATISPLNFTAGKCVTYTHPTPWIPSSPGFHDIKIWTSNLNGNADQDASNDSVSTRIFVYDAVPLKHRVVFEESTGTWCGYCPRGTVFMDSIANAYPDNTIVIAGHGGTATEPMQLGSGGYADSISYYVSGYPNILVNRGLYLDNTGDNIDPNQAFIQYNLHKDDFGLADVDLSVNYNGGIATVNATITSAVNITGDFRLACIFTEDHVTGPGDNTSPNTGDYDQVNYYGNNGLGQQLNGAGHDWDAEGDPVSHSVMEYRFVPREILGEFDGSGTIGVLPATLTAGGVYQYTFNAYAIPGSYNPANMFAHVLLFDGDHNLIMNGNTKPVLSTNVSDKTTGHYEFNVYPNPAKDQINLSLNFKEIDNTTMTVTDMLGKVCMFKDLGMLSSGLHKIPVDISELPSGSYFVTLTGENGKATSKFVK